MPDETYVPLQIGSEGEVISFPLSVPESMSRLFPGGCFGSPGGEGGGAQGTQGTQGRQGTTGVGTQGSSGAQGMRGPQGIKGNQGVQGSTGAVLAQGIQGPSGPQGIQGIQSTQGIQGVQGVQGIQGVQGAISSWNIYESALTSKTLQVEDSGRIGKFTAGTPINIVIPTGLPNTFYTSLVQMGAGQISVTSDVGVTIRSGIGATKSAYQYANISIICIGTNEFLIGGEVVP